MSVEAGPLDRATIVVLGAQGQVGHELVRELGPLGRVVPMTRSECDLSEPAAAAETVLAARPRIIVNAAAYTAVDQAETDRDRCWQINAEAPRRLAEVAATAGALLVHYSTDYVFDGTKPGAYDEDDAPNPLSEYGRSKLEGERGAAAAPAHLVFRTSWVYGTRGRNFVRTMLRLARERDELRVVGDQMGAPTWARDIAASTAQIVGQALRADESAARWGATVAGVYHMVADGATSWHGFAEAALALDPAAAEHRVRRVVPVSTADYPTPAARPLNSRLCTGRLTRTFGVRIPAWRERLALAMAG